MGGSRCTNRSGKLSCAKNHRYSAQSSGLVAAHLPANDAARLGPYCSILNSQRKGFLCYTGLWCLPQFDALPLRFLALAKKRIRAVLRSM